MSILVVGSVALDSVETPFGKADNVLGGSGTFFSASASHFSPVRVVGVIGSDYPIDALEKAFAGKPVDLAGLERSEGSAYSPTFPRRFPTSFATRRLSSSATSIRACSSRCSRRSRSPSSWRVTR